MKKNWKRMLSLLLVLVMLAGMVPSSAFADDVVQVQLICDAPGAKVTVYEKNVNGEAYEIQCSGDGFYYVLPGTYYYAAEADGYEPQEMQAFVVPEDNGAYQGLYITLTPVKQEPVVPAGTGPDQGPQNPVNQEVGQGNPLPVQQPGEQKPATVSSTTVALGKDEEEQELLQIQVSGGTYPNTDPAPYKLVEQDETLKVQYKAKLSEQLDEGTLETREIVDCLSLVVVENDEDKTAVTLRQPPKDPEDENSERDPVMLDVSGKLLERFDAPVFAVWTNDQFDLIEAVKDEDGVWHFEAPELGLLMIVELSDAQPRTVAATAEGFTVVVSGVQKGAELTAGPVAEETLAAALTPLFAADENADSAEPAFLTPMALELNATGLPGNGATVKVTISGAALRAPAEEAVFYKIVDGAAQTVDAEWNTSVGSLTFETAELGSYVLAEPNRLTPDPVKVTVNYVDEAGEALLPAEELILAAAEEERTEILPAPQIEGYAVLEDSRSLTIPGWQAEPMTATLVYVPATTLTVYYVDTLEQALAETEVRPLPILDEEQTITFTAPKVAGYAVDEETLTLTVPANQTEPVLHRVLYRSLEPIAREERTISAAAGNRTVTVSGMLPLDAELSVVEIPLDDMEEILAMQVGADAASQQVVFAYDVSIVSNGEKYDLEDYGDSVKVEISNLDAENMTVTHVKIDVTDGNGGLDEAALNAAKTEKQETETLEAESVGGEVFFDLTSCSALSVSIPRLGANGNIDVTVNVNWSGDTYIPESLVHRHAVSFTVEKSEDDGATWHPVEGTYTISGSNSDNTWSNTWSLTAGPLYRFTEIPGDLIEPEDEPHYTITGAQTTSGSNILVFNNSYNWPWPLIDKADALYKGESAVTKLHPSMTGPYTSSTGGAEASGPFEAGDTIYYNLHYTLDGAESWTVPAPYGGSSPLFDSYTNVQMELTLPKGLVLSNSGGHEILHKTTNTDGSVTYTIAVADSISAETSKKGNFYIGVYIGTNGTDIAINDYSMDDALALTAEWEIVDKMQPVSTDPTDPYFTGHKYSQKTEADGHGFSTVSPDVWALKKSLVGDQGVLKNGTVTFTWKVDVGLSQDGTPTGELITVPTQYTENRKGANNVVNLTLTEALTGEFDPAEGASSALSPTSFRIRKGTTGEWVDCPADGIQIWPASTDTDLAKLVMNSGLIDNNNDGQGDVPAPIYTSYQVEAVYTVDPDTMIGDFTQEANKINSTNTAGSSAKLSKVDDPQKDTESVFADCPLYVNDPASITITKILNTYRNGREVPVTYAGEEEIYGPLNYTVTDANGAAVDLYTFENNRYVKLAPGTALITGKKYYVLPGVAYKVTETIPAAHTNDMTPVTPGGAVTSDHVLASKEDWKANITNKETRGQIIVVKKNMAGTKTLAGAVFELKDSNGTVVDTQTTKADGQIVFDKLPYGTYTLTETTPPPGYTWDGQQPSETITINDANRLVEKTYKNQETQAEIKLTKHVGTVQSATDTSWPTVTDTDAANYFTFVLQRTTLDNPSETDWETARDINGNTFTVTLKNGSFSVKVPASEDGVTYHYRFKETISADSTSNLYLYYPADKDINTHEAVSETVTLTPGNIGDNAETVHMYNRKTARLLIYKNYYEINNDGTIASSPLKGNTYTADFQLYAFVGSGRPTASQLEESGKVGDPKTAGANPNGAEWTELPLYKNGEPVQYFIKETSGVNGFVWMQTVHGAAVSTGAPAGYLRLDPSALDGSTWSTTQRNVRNAYLVEIIKRNANTNRSDISGATVSIYTHPDLDAGHIAKDAKTPTKDLVDQVLPTVVSEQQTDARLRVYLTPGQKYYYQEGELDNYTFQSATNDEQETTVTRGGVIDLTEITLPNGGKKQYVIVNKPDPKVQIEKKNAIDKTTDVTGAVFTVYVYNTVTEAYETYPIGSTTPMTISAPTTDGGVFLPASSTLPEGYEKAYYFSESTTPSGYLNPNSENAWKEYKRLDQSTTYIWDSATGKTFVKGVVSADTPLTTFTFYNVPNTGSVKVVKKVDGSPATEKGFPVNIQNSAGTVIGSGTTGSTGNQVDAVTISNLPIYDETGNKIQYTVKEGTLPDNLADNYYLVSDGQTFKLEPGKTITQDDNTSAPKTLTINNATYIKVTGTKFKIDTWQYAHGGFTETMSGVTVGLYRRAMVKNGDTWTPYGDGKWKPTGQTVTTGADGVIDFGKLIRGEKIDGTEVSYEYALVELSSTDTDNFPYINGKVKEDGYPASGVALDDSDLFGTNAKYNALPLRVDNIAPVGSYNDNDFTADGKLYKLGDMLNGNHWVQFDITKWIDKNTLSQNQAVPIGDSNGHRRDNEFDPKAPNADKLDECIFSLYRYILPNGVDTVAFSRNEPWVCLGTYTSGHLYDQSLNPLAGEFLTAIDTSVNDRYVYVLVEESTGPSGAIPNPYFQYSVYTYPGSSVTVTGLSNPRMGQYKVDERTEDNLLNSKPTEGTGSNILLASFRLAKWRDSYDNQGNPKQIYEPLSNAKFKLFVNDLADGNRKEISRMTSGLDGGSQYAMAQSGTFQLAQNPKIKVDGTETTLTGVYLIEYEVEGGNPKYYKVGDTLSKLELHNPTSNGLTVYGIPVELEEYDAPHGYGFSPRIYPTYLIFVDGPSTTTPVTYRGISDLYFVTDTLKTTPLAEDQDNKHHWHVSCDDGNEWEAFGDSALLRIVDYPMNNVPVEVIKVGYEVNAATIQKDSHAIATGNYGAIPLGGVTMALERWDEKSTATDKWRPWDYNADNWGSSEVTFTTDESTGAFFFLHGLPMGIYRIYEKSLGSHADKYENAYDKNNGEYYRVFVVGGEPEVIYMANPRKMQLSLTKKDMVSSEKLSGWTFTLGSYTATYDEENKLYTFKDLATGSYTMGETAPSGAANSTKYFAEWFKTNYANLLDSSGKLKVGFTFKSVTHEDGDADVYVDKVSPWNSDESTIAELEIKNPPLTNFNIKKVDLDTNAPLGGAHFFVFYKPFDSDNEGKLPTTIEVTLPEITDGTSNRAVRSAFTSTGWTDLKPTSDYTVGTSGLSFNNQEPGIYVFYENSAPTGYGRLIKDGKVVLYSAVITGGLPVSVTGIPSSVTVDGKTVTTNFTSTNGAAVTVTAKDPIKAPLYAKKIANYGELGTADIGNWSVTLDVYDAPTNGSRVGTVTIEKGTTDAVGFKVSPNSGNQAYFNIGQDYYLQETVNSTQTGYADAAHFPIVSVKLLKQGDDGIEEETITLGENEKRYKFRVDRKDGFTIEVTDQYLYGYVNFWKLDDDPQDRPGLSGASFKVLKTPGNPDDPDNLVPGSSVEEIKVNGEGTGRYHAYIPLMSAEETTYYIYETQPPAGYVIDEDHRFFPVKLSANNNVKDYTVQPGENAPWRDAFTGDKPSIGEYDYYIPNAKGRILTIEKYANLHGAETDVPVVKDDATFTIYKLKTENPELWEAVDVISTDDQGKITYTMTPFVSYAIAETDFNVSKFNGLEGIYLDGVKQSLSDIPILVNNQPTTVKAVKLGEAKTVTFKAYNIPIYTPTIAKIDVGLYPAGVRPMMDFEIYEVDSSFTATPDTVAALVANESVTPVFKSSTTDDFSLAEETGENAVTNFIGTSTEWTAGTPEKRWDYTKRYLLVETFVGAVAGGPYDSMTKGDPRVEWYYVAEPVENPEENLAPWVLRNVYGDVSLKLEKSVVGTDTPDDDVNSVDISTVTDGNGRVDSLLEHSRKIVYDIVPTVKGSNQMLHSFILEDSGLTYNPETSADGTINATFEYSIDTLLLGGATHSVPKAVSKMKENFDPSIKAVVTFDVGNPVTVSIPDDISETVSVTVPEGATSFKAEYYCADVKEVTGYSVTTTTDEQGAEISTITGYQLGGGFRVGKATMTVTVEKTPKGTADSPAVPITDFTNTAKASLNYPQWTARGAGPVNTTLSKEDTALVTVGPLSLPLVSVSKGHLGNYGVDEQGNLNPIQTGKILTYQVTVKNTGDPAVDFVNPVLLDILPTGVTFYRQGTVDVEVTGTGNMKVENTYTKIGEPTQKITVTTETGTTEQVFGDAETAVIFMLEGTLNPGDEMTLKFDVKVGASAVLYETGDGGVVIENEVYLSSSEHTYRTEDNPNGYSFTVGDGDDKFGTSLKTSAAGVNQGTGDPAELHEQGVHNWLGTDEDGQSYVNPTDYVWVAAQDKIPVVRGADLTLVKGVRGDQDEGYMDSGIGTATRTVIGPTGGATPTHNKQEGWVDWRLTVNNGYEYAQGRIIVGDVIPKVGDSTNFRRSWWDVDFDYVDLVKANGVKIEPDEYTVYYYSGTIQSAQSALDLALKPGTAGLRGGASLAGWSTSIPVDQNGREDKSLITAFAIVFDQTVDDPQTTEVEGLYLRAGSSLIITYHTLVHNYPDDEEFNERYAFQNADNMFYAAVEDDVDTVFSNTVSVTMLDQLVSVEGDVWIDEDWDAEQQSTNRRDYSGYAIVDALKDNITFHIIDGRNGSDKGQASIRNTEIGYGESILHFTSDNWDEDSNDWVKTLGPAVYVEGRTLYGPGDYLNAGDHKIDAFGALKGSDPFHYWLTSALGSNAPTSVIELTDLGPNHYKSDDPDTELTADAAQTLDNNFYFLEGSSTNFMTHPFYVRYSNNVDKSKDIGFKFRRDLVINKVADNAPEVTLEGVKFEIYGPYEDTDLKDPSSSSGANYAKKTPAYGYAGDGKLKFTLTTDGIYQLDPNGDKTELITDDHGQIKVSGLNWWKEYLIKETATIEGFTINGSASATDGAQIVAVENEAGSYMLKVPGKTKIAKADEVTITNTPLLDFEFMKVGEDPDNSSTTYPLNGVVFGLYTDPECNDEYTDADNNHVTATSGLKADGTPGVNGKVEFKSLPYGTYYMKELSLGPDNEDFYWNNNTIYKIDVPERDPDTGKVVDPAHVMMSVLPAAGGTTGTGDGTGTTGGTNGTTGDTNGAAGDTTGGTTGDTTNSATNPVAIETGELKVVQLVDQQGHTIYTYTIVNKPIKLKIELYKIEEPVPTPAPESETPADGSATQPAGSTAAPKPLAGAVFWLYNASDMTIQDGKVLPPADPEGTIAINKVTTDASGKADLGWLKLNEKIEIAPNKLKWQGHYYLVEKTAPPNHIKLKDPIEIKFSKNTDGTIAAYYKQGNKETAFTVDGLASFRVTVTNKAFGSLIIQKKLLTFELSEDAAFIFDVVGMIAGNPDPVYSTTAMLTFEKDKPTSLKSTILEHIPAGAVVTVTERYTGSHYTLVSDPTQTKTIVANDSVTVNFINDYNEDEKGGHGVVNMFNPINTGNGWEWVPDIDTPAPTQPPTPPTPPEPEA